MDKATIEKIATLLFPIGGMLPEKERLSKLNPDSPQCDIVGNRDALTRLYRYAFADGAVNLAFVGPAGVGKTTIARAFADAKDIPLVEIQPQMVASVNDVLAAIADNYETRGKELMETTTGSKLFVPAPCAVFFDEVHALRNNVIQGLLKAAEPSDRTMVTEKGFTVDCSNISWLIATTELGLLFQPFKSRFNLVRLKLYTKAEVTKIVNKRYPKWHSSVCEWIAYYSGRVPREALALAKDVELELDMQKKLAKTPDMVEVIGRIAKENGIDSLGMRMDRLTALTMLGQGPASKARLCATLGINEEELIRDVMPPIMALTEESAPLVSTSSRGFVITDAGREELDERKIPHNGHEEE